MPTAWRITFVCIAIGLPAWCRSAAGAEALQPTADYAHFARPFVEQYCFDCHTGDEPEAGLSFDKVEGALEFQRHRSAWKKIAARIRAGDMPPPDYDTPGQGERERMLQWIDARLAEFNCEGPQNPGWVTLRRLNRDQYRNTIRELLSVDFEPTESFPPDELAYGFDNNGDALSLTPSLLEKYLAASEKIASQAILAPETLTRPLVEISRDRWQGAHHNGSENQSLYREGVIDFVYDFPAEGRYLLRATVAGDQAGDEPVRMGLVDAGRIIKTVEVYASHDESEVYVAELKSDAGQQRVGVTFLNDYYDPSEPQGSNKGDRNLIVRKFEIVGPIDLAMGAPPAAHRRWFADSPSLDQWRDEQAWRPTARNSLERFARDAYRRPAPAAEIDRLVELADRRRLAGDTYERAMQVVLQVMLVSPRFLFIGSVDHMAPEPQDAELGYAIDEYELASRLSYFLWSSMPDRQLMQLASEGKLREQLEGEVTRMLRDRKAEQFASNFTGQWLGTRLLEEFEPDEKLYGKFGPKLREAMAREAELVFGEVLREDKPITTLIDADFTYLNARLAEHYSLPDVSGNYFRRVSLSNLPAATGVRGGVLTMAGVLAVTSNPNRTSPVKRGKWILGDLLGEAPPAPPPGTDSLPVKEPGEAPKTIREQMELHRENPSCAVCHKQMDILGFSLENYDPVGRWRTSDDVGPIDASGELPGGQKIDGVDDLKQVLLARKDEFRTCLAEKMLTYALGRGLDYYDECAVREITDRLKKDDDKIRTLVMATIESQPFQKRRHRVESKEN